MTSEPLDNATISAWVDWLAQNETSTTAEALSWWVGIEMHGGAISRINCTETAYTNRDAILSWQFYGSADDFESVPGQRLGMEFLTNMANKLVAEPKQAYPNYVDPNLEDEEWQQQYFGANIGRLVKLRNEYDPGHLFTFPQSIPFTLDSK